jgi:hypothetical protein
VEGARGSGFVNSLYYLRWGGAWVSIDVSAPIGVITGRHSYENRFKVSKGRDSRKSAMKGRCFRRSYVLEGSYRSRGDNFASGLNLNLRSVSSNGELFGVHLICLLLLIWFLLSFLLNNDWNASGFLYERRVRVFPRPSLLSACWLCRFEVGDLFSIPNSKCSESLRLVL